MLNMKYCKICKTNKPKSAFNKDNTRKDGLQYMCRICHNEYKKEYQKKHCRKLRDYKKTLKCEVCGEDRWYCLDFHHKNPEEKEFKLTIANTKFISWEKIKKEIDKCIVICANCHREIHYGM